MSTWSRTWSSIPRLLAVVAVVIAVALGFNLGRQATVIHRLRSEEARLEQAVAQEKAKAEALRTRKAYVLTNDFVEEWARTVAKLARPGEVRVVGIAQKPADSMEPDWGLQHLQGKKALPYWEQWWELFFGPAAQGGFD